MTFNRIDPNHPLTRAARENNAKAETTGMEKVLDEIGMTAEATMSQIFYLAEQRAYRVFAARRGEVNPTGPVKLTVREQEEMAGLISAYVDGMAIGWLGHQYAAINTTLDELYEVRHPEKN